MRAAASPPILDVGCGYGFFVECARRFGVPAVGLEPAAHGLREARRRHPQADIREWSAGLPFPVESSSIGAALLNQVVDHFTLEENRTVFGEVARVLAPDGVLLVYSPSRYNRFDEDSGHVTFFSPSEFREFVQSFGFRVVAQPYHLQPLLGRTRAGTLLLRAMTQFFRPERLAATIDLVAERVTSGTEPGEHR